MLPFHSILNSFREIYSKLTYGGGGGEQVFLQLQQENSNCTTERGQGEEGGTYTSAKLGIYQVTNYHLKLFPALLLWEKQQMIIFLCV